MSIVERAPKQSLAGRFDLFLRDGLSGAVGSLALRGLGIAVTFFSQLLLARTLGAYGTGIVVLAVTVAGVPAALAVLGLDNTLIRFVGAAKARQDWSEILGLARISLQLSAIASTIGGMMLFFAAPLLARELFEEPALIFPLELAALSIVPFTLNRVLVALLKAVGRPLVATLAETTGPAMLWLITLGLIALTLGPAFDSVSAVSAYSGTLLLVLAIVFLVWRRVLPHVPSVASEAQKRRLFKSSAPLFWITSVQLVMSLADTLMLGVFFEADQIGVYNVALRLASLVSLILIAVNTVLPPRFSALWAEGRKDELRRLARQTTVFLWITSVPVVLLFVLWPSDLLQLFGPEFVDGRFALVVLTLGQFVNVATGPVGYLLIMSGHEWLLRNVVVVATITNITLDLLLIPTFGVNGAAVASAVSLALLNLAALVLVRRRLSLRSTFCAGSGQDSGPTGGR